MVSIPGITNALPGVYTDVITQSRGVSVPGGSRIAALVGEGSTDQTLVSTAQGGGKDGLDPTYSSTTGSDGRHFIISQAPVISNRTTLFKNGVPLVGKESLIDSLAFSYKYDYRIDIATGRIELQKAHLVDLGGTNYLPLSTNVGLGSLGALALVDVNAPKETWTIRCVGVQRDVSNLPIGGTAKFLAFGSVSGAKLDANGNPVVWKADGVVVSNGVISFSISETTVSMVVTSPFREGDAFTLQIASGVLNRSDSLTVNFIPVANMNDPLLLQGLNDVAIRHGFPSVSNSLSLGAQLAFANNAPALLTVQAAPSMPRRTSFVLSAAVNATSSNLDDFIFPLPLDVTPDFNSPIHFFTTNNATGTESQILPNKLDYYLIDLAGQPTTTQFINSVVAAPSGYSYFYTVKQSPATIYTGSDGYIGRNLAFTTKGVFSGSTTFDASYTGKTLKVIDAVNQANVGTYLITSVAGGKLYVTNAGFSDFTTQTAIAFSFIDPATGLAVPGAAATDGYITPIAATATGTFGSSALSGVNFSSFPVTTLKLIITGSSVGNNGLYDVSTFNAGANTIKLTKTVVNESTLRFEVIDSSQMSNYVVINKNVVPNGYGLRVSLIDNRDASFYDAGWEAALASLEVVECDILVTLPKQTISVIFQNALSHCKSMSNIKNRKERMLIAGTIAGLTPANLIGTKLAAVENVGILEGIQGETVTDILAGNIEDLANYSVPDAFGNTYRCIYMGPDQIVVQAGTDNVLIDGFYLAAAAAGYLSADTRLENPLTNKTLTGFSILRNKQYSSLVLEQLAAAGICILQPVTGGGKVVWGLTTSQSGFPEEQEISIVFIRDRIAKTLRAGFAGYVGQAETQETPITLSTRAVIIMNSLVSQNLITAYKDLFVVRNGTDPRQWDISVRCQPAYPVNFIYIKIGLGQL